MKAVRVFLDNSMEIAIALARLLAMVGAIGSVALAFVAIWTPEGEGTRMAATLLLSCVLTLALGVFGFYTFGNEEWRRGTAEDRGTALRND